MNGSHYVATHGRSESEPPYLHANRGYSTDGEESHSQRSHRAPSERSLSEYRVAHERSTPPTAPIRKSRLNNVYQNGGPAPLSSPPQRMPPRAPSALSYEHGGDTGSDIYVTSAAYRAPSELR